MSKFSNGVRPLFPGQQPGEKIHRVTRQHWVVLAKHIAVWLIFAALLLLYDGYFSQEYEFLQTVEAQRIAGVIKSLYLLYLVAGLFTIWILYYLNYQVITNKRLVDVDQKGLLFHASTEMHLSQIEDVTSEIKGILGNLFNYGTVYVQTAGARAMFEIDNVPNPKAIAQLILDLYEQVPLREKVRPKGDD